MSLLSSRFSPFALFPKPPTLFVKPAFIPPSQLVNQGIAASLTKIFHTAIEEGELDFLAGQSIAFDIQPINLQFSLTLNTEEQLVAYTGETDLTISGQVVDFLRLIRREEDADTLFFQRRLTMSGSTELGLAMKNFLDSIELESLPFYPAIDKSTAALLKVHHRFLHSFKNRS